VVITVYKQTSVQMDWFLPYR